MAVVANKRSSMTMYSGGSDPYSHQVRIVLAEKGVTVDIIDVKSEHPPEDLVDLNPYNSVPTIVDRELVLYQANIIMEYLDERFPHPPLMPVYPVARAQSRLMLYRIEKDWYSLMYQIQCGDGDIDAARAELKDNLLALAPVFAETPYFLSEEFSLVDCALAPLLWRLPILGIELTGQGSREINAYAVKIFQRESFRASLSDAEREMRG